MGCVDDRVGALQMNEVSAAVGRRLASGDLLICEIGTRSIVARDAFLPCLITRAASGRGRLRVVQVDVVRLDDLFPAVLRRGARNAVFPGGIVLVLSPIADQLLQA